MQLGGTPPQLYDQARDGVVDIVWTLPGITPGRFPRIEVFELPFVAAQARGIVERAGRRRSSPNANLAKEIRATCKLLCFWAHDHGLIHANKQVKTMEDLKGLKLRSPTRLAGEALKALGATAIGMPIPQVPESLAQRVIDGAVVPWEVVPAIKLHELVKFHTEIPGSPTLYTASFFLAMNKAKYDGLPADLKAVIDKNSGMKFAELAGNMWDEPARWSLDMVKKRGNTITTISERREGQVGQGHRAGDRGLGQAGRRTRASTAASCSSRPARWSPSTTRPEARRADATFVSRRTRRSRRRLPVAGGDR